MDAQAFELAFVWDLLQFCGVLIVSTAIAISGLLAAEVLEAWYWSRRRCPACRRRFAFRQWMWSSVYVEHAEFLAAGEKGTEGGLGDPLPALSGTRLLHAGAGAALLGRVEV